MNKLTRNLTGALAFLLSSYSFATLIETIDESDFNTLKINNSFETFYNYGGQYGGVGTDRYSSNTGYELSDVLTLFFIENPDNEVALFGLIDLPGDKSGGELSLSINTLSGDGSLLSFIFIDDSGDASRNGTNLTKAPGEWDIKWKWGKNYNDGFILSGFEKDSFIISLTMNSQKGLTDFNMLPFSTQTNENSNSISVNEPSSIALFFFFVCGRLLLGKKRCKLPFVAFCKSKSSLEK